MSRVLDRCKSDDDIRDMDVRPKSGKPSQSISLPITPQKQAGILSDDPLTPTANLKMLVSAAFKIANARDEKKEKRELFTDSNEDEYQEDSCSTVSDMTDDKEKIEYCNTDNKRSTDGASAGRKQKSLGLLCQKFLSQYPKGSEGKLIYLHDVAKELNVERRRIYDIVNVLESLEFVTKQGKNTYLWHGSERLIPTLCKLKALAMKICEDKDPNCSIELSKDNAQSCKNSNISSLWPNHGIVAGDQESETPEAENVSTKQDDDGGKRRSKSLGIFCQKLILLFIISKNPVIALEDAAKEIIEGTEDPTGKTKTKVRRLYDIANILSSMGLIEKTGSRKAAFKWIGVDLQTLPVDTETIEKVLNSKDEYISTRHSLFNLPSPAELSKQGLSAVRKLESRSLSANNIIIHKKNKMPRTKSAAAIPRKRSSTDSNEGDIETRKILKKEQQTECQTDMLGNKTVSSPKSLVTEEDQRDAKKLVNFVAASPKRTLPKTRDLVSPNERSFREELKKLQERFPDKLQNRDGLLNLLTAHNEIQNNEIEDNKAKGGGDKGSRCCLLERLEGEPMEKNELSDQNAKELSGKSEVLESKEERRGLSMSCLEVIVDQVQDKKNVATIRSEIEKAIKRSQDCINFNEGAQENANRSQTLLMKQDIVAPSIQKASVGIQTSLLNGISPLRPVNAEPATCARKRKASFNEWLSGTSSESKKEQKENQSPTRDHLKTVKEPVRIPVFSTTNAISLNSTNRSPPVTPSSFPLFLLSLKQNSPESPIRTNSDAIPLSLIKSPVNKSNIIKASNLKTSPERKDGVVEMVPIAPTLINLKSGLDKENYMPVHALQGQGNPLINNVRPRILVPFRKSTNSDVASSIFLANGRQSMRNEETPMRDDILDLKVHRVQRQLSKLSADKS